jgi:DNA-directed RNA polymerase specialized sigma24 family protein
MFGYDEAMAVAGNTDTQQIARGLRQRDVALLHELVVEYQFRLVRYLIYLLGRRDSVDDLVQETWLRVLERGRSYDGHSRFEPWLFTIARNLTIDHLRQRRIFSLDSNSASWSPICWDFCSTSPYAGRSLYRVRSAATASRLSNDSAHGAVVK